MFKIYRNLVLKQCTGFNRFGATTWHNGFSSATIPEMKNVNTHNSTAEEKSPESSSTQDSTKVKGGSKMIKTIFSSMKLDDHSNEIETPFTDSKLSNATSVDELLSISEGNGVSRKHALKVVSILSNWTSSGKVKLSDFERDPRFIRLCKVMTRNGSSSNHSKLSTIPKSDDLTTVLSVTADEEAAKLVSSITLAQMVKVLTTLSIKKRRSTLLLRTLAFNIAASTEKMDIKQCADLFFSISSLNFYDENLFETISNNTISILRTQEVRKSAVVGSILTSVGLLKYKNPALLDAISEWIVEHHSNVRPQDIFSLFMTLGVLNYAPSNSEHMYKSLLPQLTKQEAGKPSVWLEIVWSLVLLNQATAEHLQSVLNETFIDSLQERNCLNTSAILKLLNIDGAAHYLLRNYNGPKISKDHDIRQTVLLMTREKTQLLNSVIDTLKNLIPVNYFRTRVNTGLGFYIDAECVLDKTCNPLPLTGSTDASRLRVAFLTHDYHDLCKGRIEPTGVNVLSQRLLTAMGFRVVTIPYTDFKPTDKIVNRVQYLENQLKETVKQ